MKKHRSFKPEQKAVEQVVGQFPTYGSWRVAYQLRREHGEFKAIGRKRVRRVLGEMGLKLRPKAVKKQTTDSRHCFPRGERVLVSSRRRDHQNHHPHFSFKRLPP